jgi:hypothetical protein
MYEILGGWERGKKQLQALLTRVVRVEIGCMIDVRNAADEKAFGLLQELLKVL